MNHFIHSRGLIFGNLRKHTLNFKPTLLRTHTRTFASVPNTGNSKQKQTNNDNAKETGSLDYKLLMEKFPPSKVRNFSIIAHVDHGKTTLSTKLLTITNTISESAKNEMYLDKLQVEKERGITVKAQTCSMLYEDPKTKETYILNLIDTPGHVDFNYEVSRSLLACQGALLVVDATQGIQAQTMANFYLAFDMGLSIIPIINKVDLPTARPNEILEDLKRVFDLSPSQAIHISAKTGLNVDAILPAVVQNIKPPSGDATKPLKALLFDSWYDRFRGVVCLMSVIDGIVKKGDIVVSAATLKEYEIIEVGIMHPEQQPSEALYAGQVGYIIPQMKTAKEARVGDTFYIKGKNVEPLPGFKPAKPMVFAGVYPSDSDDFERLRDSIEKLGLTDASISIEKESSAALGFGFRCGFLGLLHMDVFMQRLEQEYGTSVIATSPTVPYKVVFRNKEEKIISNPADFPDAAEIDSVFEPMVNATINAPQEHMGAIIKLCLERRGIQTYMQTLEGPSASEGRIQLRYLLPLSEIVVNFYDRLKQISSGYATLDYEDSDYVESKVVKLNILLNDEPVDALSSIVHMEKAQQQGRVLVEKLREVVPRQMFAIAIQAAVGGKILARESLTALRKDVTAKCYGGDVTRRMKLLEKQKEGKKRMRQIGRVELPQEAFETVLKVK